MSNRPQATQPPAASTLNIKIGPERTVLPGAQLPYTFRARSGRLVVIGQLPVPPTTPYPGGWATTISEDNAQTWSTPSAAGSPNSMPFYEGCAAQLDDGTILWLGHAARGPEPDGAWLAPLWESRDDLHTLQGPHTARLNLPRAKGGFDDDGHAVPHVFLHRSVIVLPGGDLLLTVYGWFVGDDTPSTYRPSMLKFRTLLLRSSDRGRNWSLVSTVAVDPSVGEEGFNEPAMVRLTRGPRAGRLIVLLRTGSNKTFAHNPIYQTESDDEGRTWTRPRPLPFENVDPDIIEMDNGTLVASCGFRTPESRVHLTSEPKTIGPGHGNYVSFSLDQGETWTHTTRVTDMPSCCYTTVRQIGPGRLLLVYDVGDWFQHVWIGHEGIKRAVACRVIEVG